MAEQRNLVNTHTEYNMNKEWVEVKVYQLYDGRQMVEHWCNGVLMKTETTGYPMKNVNINLVTGTPIILTSTPVKGNSFFKQCADGVDDKGNPVP